MSLLPMSLFLWTALGGVPDADGSTEGDGEIGSDPGEDTVSAVDGAVGSDVGGDADPGGASSLPLATAVTGHSASISNCRTAFPTLATISTSTARLEFPVDGVRLANPYASE